MVFDFQNQQFGHATVLGNRCWSIASFSYVTARHLCHSIVYIMQSVNYISSKITLSPRYW